MVFARTTARLRVATGLAAQTAGHAAATRPTSLRAEIVKILFASVAFISSDARFAGALALAIALQTSRTLF